MANDDCMFFLLLNELLNYDIKVNYTCNIVYYLELLEYEIVYIFSYTPDDIPSLLYSIS